MQLATYLLLLTTAKQHRRDLAAEDTAVAAKTVTIAVLASKTQGGCRLLVCRPFSSS
jgi:hypothetical protein